MVATFDFDTSDPGDSDVVSQHPADARAFRQTVHDAFDIEHESDEGRHKFGVGSVATRDAITKWSKGSIWINTDDTPASIGYQANAISPFSWVSVSAVPADASVTAAKIATDAVTTVKINADAVTAAKLADTAVTAAAYTYSSLTVDAQGRLTAASSGAAPLPLVPGEVSAEIAVGTSALITTAHGLGAIPGLVEVRLVCKSADLGYSVGDEVIYTNVGGGVADRGATISCNATNIFIQQGTDVRLNQKTGGQTDPITNSKWRWKIRGWASV